MPPKSATPSRRVQRLPADTRRLLISAKLNQSTSNSGREMERIHLQKADASRHLLNSPLNRKTSLSDKRKELQESVRSARYYRSTADSAHTDLLNTVHQLRRKIRKENPDFFPRTRQGTKYRRTNRTV
ncbi:MAG: hypothetical protein Q7R47_05080 [Candidatus Diapherotrites archaeon]|nr:hypothetical protein [Candidatus Diapherotrites archaeon]